MIKFFRNIRQNLIMENKTGNYLKYAIGEIVLVMIGILLALQVNNWNEKRKDRILESTYYCRILDDFELDLQLIVQTHLELDKKIDSAKPLLLDMYHSKKDNNTLINDWVKVQRLQVFVPRKLTFEDLTTSGNLKLLTDMELKNSLALYYSDLENILKQISQNRDELVKRSFPEDITGFGFQELNYLKNILGNEIFTLLPQPNWMHNPDDPTFKKFQNNLLLLIALYDRQRQHLNKISENMEFPYQLLQKKCTDKTLKTDD